jgi:ribosomal protein L15E
MLGCMFDDKKIDRRIFQKTSRKRIMSWRNAGTVWRVEKEDESKDATAIPDFKSNQSLNIVDL